MKVDVKIMKGAMHKELNELRARYRMDLGFNAPPPPAYEEFEEGVSGLVIASGQVVLNNFMVISA